jgi:hypothetical protein
MEIIVIEKETFEQMMQSFEKFTRNVKELCGNDRSNEKWLDGTEVCKLAQISRRSLQSYRDSGILPYTQIVRKCYYKTSDVERLFNQSKTKIN